MTDKKSLRQQFQEAGTDFVERSTKPRNVAAMAAIGIAIFPFNTALAAQILVLPTIWCGLGVALQQITKDRPNDPKI